MAAPIACVLEARRPRTFSMVYPTKQASQSKKFGHLVIPPRLAGQTNLVGTLITAGASLRREITYLSANGRVVSLRLRG